MRLIALLLDIDKQYNPMWWLACALQWSFYWIDTSAPHFPPPLWLFHWQLLQNISYFKNLFDILLHRYSSSTYSKTLICVSCTWHLYMLATQILKNGKSISFFLSPFTLTCLVYLLWKVRTLQTKRMSHYLLKMQHVLWLYFFLIYWGQWKWRNWHLWALPRVLKDNSVLTKIQSKFSCIVETC